MTDTSQLPDALIERGWQIVSPEGAEIVQLERLRSSKAIRATGKTLDEAIEDANEFARRNVEYAQFVRSSSNPTA